MFIDDMKIVTKLFLSQLVFRFFFFRFRVLNSNFF